MSTAAEFKQIDELDSTEYDWFCDHCGEVFDGKYANFPQDGICDPCLAKKVAKTPKLVEDIPF